MNSKKSDGNPKDAAIQVRTLESPNEWSNWAISVNLTDRWGEINWHDGQNKPLAALMADTALLERLRAQMWDECTFITRKDGKFGLLFEVEYCSRESESELDSARDQYSPHETVVAGLLNGMRAIAGEYPGVEFGVPHQSAVYSERPAAWAFVPDGLLSEAQRRALGLALLRL